MTDQANNPVNSFQQATSNPFLQLIEHLKPLHELLAQNSYVRDTTRRLERIILDAQNQPMFLLLGKERVGKTTLINAILGRELLSTRNLTPTRVNTFIKYGEKEWIKAVFLDGMEAAFDLNKIELLTTADSFSAQIIREHLDYIEIYIKHDFLCDVTLVDSTALELAASNSAYFSQSVMNRVDELFWVLRCGSMATEAEVKFLNKLNQKGIKPYFIINATDQFDGSVASFIESEKKRYGSLISDMISVSARQAIEARKTNDAQLLIDSHSAELTQLIRRTSHNPEKKTRQITERVINWLELLRREIELIPTREPYLSALETIEHYDSDTNLEFSRPQRAMAGMSAYEEEFRHVSEVFKPVQTLYQLLQVLASEVYLRSPEVEHFEERAIRYHQAVREYRKLHSEFNQEFLRFEKQHKKLHSKGLKASVIVKEEDRYTKDKIARLNQLQSLCEEVFVAIQQYEKQMLDDLTIVQHHLNDLAMRQLKTILVQVRELNVQQKQEHVVLTSYVNKLTEFNCIVEAQGFVRDVLQPYLIEGSLLLSEEEKTHVQHTIESICAVNLTQEGFDYLSPPCEKDEIAALVHFETNYQLIGLNLIEADVISDLPKLPARVKVEEVSL